MLHFKKGIASSKLHSRSIELISSDGYKQSNCCEQHLSKMTDVLVTLIRDLQTMSY